MARTTTMRLVELMVLNEDIDSVLKYLGEFGDFQFQQNFSDMDAGGVSNPNRSVYDKLENARCSLNLDKLESYKGDLCLPVPDDYDSAVKIIDAVEGLHKKELQLQEKEKSVSSSYAEALAFSNLKVSYQELESLSFLTLRIGKIDPEKFESLKENVSSHGIVIPLGNDASKILVASSKKDRLLVDNELKSIGFIEIALPKDFKGIPEDVLDSLKNEKDQASKALFEIQGERKNFAETHKDELYRLIQAYSIGYQIADVKNNLESTEFVYRISGWIPAYRTHDMLKDMDDLTCKRAGVRVYLPSEVASVVSGAEKVPVQLKHGKLVKNFERVIFSYGSPLYGTVDPTPLVAIFFTVLFGIMFGDAGQGLVFLILGILMYLKLIKLAGWEKFGLVFVSIGVSSTVMGLLTGEFFANDTLLVPFSRFVTGLFGEPRNVILHMMPSSDPESIRRMFMFFGFTVAVGFVINTSGILLNIINQFCLHRLGKALFGKTGLSGAIFFWYVIVFAVRVAFLSHVPAPYDWVIILGSLLLTAFGETFERLVDKKRPVFENGVSNAIISAVVEIIEVVSSYLSNTVSFLRVGAFALAHAVLGYIIQMMAGIAPSIGGALVLIVGNAIVIVLEGMIVAIQVVRLQYYEFFSKFFNETGREFAPFTLKMEL